MEILRPAAYFLRVEDKFFGDFICEDKAVRQGPTVLYLNLFKLAYRTGCCRISQARLAAKCKCSIRAIQHFVRVLESLAYIRVIRETDSRLHHYELLLSPRVKKFIELYEVAEGEDFSPVETGQAKDLRVQGENSAPVLKSIKSFKRKEYTPLSPLPQQRHSLRVQPSTNSAFPASGGRSLPETTGGRGDFSTPGKGRTAFLAANAAFEQFISSYPRNEARESARGVWHQLWRRGELPALERLLTILGQFRSSFAWTKEHGRFVPYAVNWLRNKRWLDFAESEHKAPAPAPLVQALPEARPDPELAAARPCFEQFFSRFAASSRRGPAWGLWAALFRQGQAPSAGDVRNHGMMDAFAFLKQWQRQQVSHAT